MATCAGAPALITIGRLYALIPNRIFYQLLEIITMPGQVHNYGVVLRIDSPRVRPCHHSCSI